MCDTRHVRRYYEAVVPSCRRGSRLVTKTIIDCKPRVNMNMAYAKFYRSDRSEVALAAAV